MKILSGNDLPTGDVVWWTGEGWSRDVAEAIDVGEHGPAIIAVEEAARRVNVAYALDAEPGANGPRPRHIKDRIRAYGPTVRPDLERAPADPARGQWVI